MECSKREGKNQCTWYSTGCLNPSVSLEIKRECNGQLPRYDGIITDEIIPQKSHNESLKMIKKYKGVPSIYIVLAVIVALAYGWFMPQPATNIKGLWILFLNVFVGFIVMVVVHELLHGILFKIYTGKVKFGFLPKKIAFYATSPNSFITKEHFIQICLLPQILVFPCLLVAWISTTPMVEYIAITIFVFNFLGGISDWWVAFTLARYKENILVEDTMSGMTVYQNITTLP
jgi:Protein of unknown function (DUF3267).